MLAANAVAADFGARGRPEPAKDYYTDELMVRIPKKEYLFGRPLQSWRLPLSIACTVAETRTASATPTLPGSAATTAPALCASA